MVTESKRLSDPLTIEVDGGDVNRALRVFMKKLSREGVMKEVKMRRFYEKPSVKKKRKSKEAEKRRRKVARKVSRLGSVRAPRL